MRNDRSIAMPFTRLILCMLLIATSLITHAQNNIDKANSLPPSTPQIGTMINEDGTIATSHANHPNCHCVIDTIELVQPDGDAEVLLLFVTKRNVKQIDTIENMGASKKPIEVYQNPEQMPKFEGGKISLSAYIKQALLAKQLDEKLRGQVEMHFIVLKTGKIENIIIDNTTQSPSVIQAIISIMKNLPAWVPGKVKGQRVNAYYYLNLF